MKLKTIYAPLKKDLRKIEDALIERIDAQHPILQEASLQLIKAGGKRIRPVFVLLSSQFGDVKKYEAQINAVAVSLELIHMATLVHDDVVDDASLRRGKPTVKSTYDNRIAAYSGDYLLARALEIITTIEQPEIHRVLSKTLVNVVEGEFDQLRDKFIVNQTLRQYLRRIKRKTALLIASSCKLGALASHASKEHVHQLYKYGYYVGMSFQIIDDILDFTASPEELGKPTGSDLLQGNITLPFLYAMEDDTFRKQITELFKHKQIIFEDELAYTIKALLKTDAIERAYHLSDLYLNKAIDAVNKLPKENAKETLQIIAHLIGRRRF